MARWLPHPALSVSLLALWLLLVNDASPGHVVLGGLLGIAIPLFTRAFWPDRPRLGNPRVAVRLFFTVLWDIVVANVTVARIILTRPAERLRPHFLVIPLEVESPYAVTLLAGIITMTPGTVSADLDGEGRQLLVHALDVADPRSAVAEIKARYETPLREIFDRC